MKFKKPKNTAPIDTAEKGEATREMEAIMDAASDATSEIELLLDVDAPAEDLTEDASAVEDGIDDIPDAFESPEIPADAETAAQTDADPAAAEDAPAAPIEEIAAEPSVSTEDVENRENMSDDDDAEDELQPTEPAPDEEVTTEQQPAKDTADSADPEGYKNLGLYLHIPFCKSKCRYCDFCSFPHSGEAEMDAYVEALCRDLQGRRETCSQYTVDTVYFGGGTPTYLGAARLERIL